jgi:hypothetical protein
MDIKNEFDDLIDLFKECSKIAVKRLDLKDMHEVITKNTKRKKSVYERIYHSYFQQILEFNELLYLYRRAIEDEDYVNHLQLVSLCLLDLKVSKQVHDEYHASLQ